jgi:PST family polysaccharide transporter
VPDFFDEYAAPPDHMERSLRGGAMSVGARAIAACIQITSVLFLARLLSPEDYGLVAMAMAFTGFAPLLTDLGTQDAIARTSRISEIEVSALFWITFAVGLGCAALLTVTSPVVARLYGEPRLTAIVTVSALTFVTSALAVQHAAIMRRASMFRELAAIEVGSNLLSACCAVAVALLGYQYWALLVRPVVTPLIAAAGMWSKARWWPGRPQMTMGVKSALKLGLNITGYSMFDFASRVGDRIAIGSRAGAAVLGQYQQAVAVYDNIANILVAPLHAVAVPGLSKLRDDLTALRYAWAKALSTVAFYAMPAFGLLAAISKDVVVLLLGSKWSGAGVLLGVLALRGIPQSVERTAGWLHVTAGCSDRLMRYGLFAAATQLIALFCGLPFGAMGIAVAYVVAMFVLFVPALAYAGRPLGIGVLDVIGAVWRPLTGSLTSAALVYALDSLVDLQVNSGLRAAVFSAVYLFSYLLIVTGALRLRAPLRTARVLIQESVPARFVVLFKRTIA